MVLRPGLLVDATPPSGSLTGLQARLDELAEALGNDQLAVLSELLRSQPDAFGGPGER